MVKKRWIKAFLFCFLAGIVLTTPAQADVKNPFYDTKNGSLYRKKDGKLLYETPVLVQIVTVA